MYAIEAVVSTEVRGRMASGDSRVGSTFPKSVPGNGDSGQSLRERNDLWRLLA